MSSNFLAIVVFANVILGNVTIYNAIFTNNILRDGSVSGTATTFNNIGNSLQFPSGNGNQSNVNMTTVFVGAGSTDGQWQLKAGSPAIGAGLSSVDIEMFGGPTPYMLSGLPPIPAVYSITAPTTTAGNQAIPVTVKIKSHQ